MLSNQLNKHFKLSPKLLRAVPVCTLLIRMSLKNSIHVFIIIYGYFRGDVRSHLQCACIDIYVGINKRLKHR